MGNMEIFQVLQCLFVSFYVFLGTNYELMRYIYACKTMWHKS